MQYTIERIGKLFLAVEEHYGKKFYNLDDILRQTGRQSQYTPMVEQKPLKLNCGIIIGLGLNGENFIRSVFVDETGLKSLARDWVKSEFEPPAAEK